MLSALARIRCRHDRFQCLLKDKPTGRTIENRAVATTRDYRQAYLIKLAVSSVLSCITVLLSFVIFPEIRFTSLGARVAPEVIHLENIPETSQRRFAPRSQRPSVPLAVDDEDASEDATIEITDLEFDRIPLDLPTGKEVVGMDDPPRRRRLLSCGRWSRNRN